MDNATVDIMIRPACPSCGRKFASIKASTVATVVVSRMCPNCGERWQAVVKPLGAIRDGMVHRVDLAFLGHVADLRFTK